jgi:carboxypeptidase C (cathepsin A)
MPLSRLAALPLLGPALLPALLVAQGGARPATAPVPAAVTLPVAAPPRAGGEALKPTGPVVTRGSVRLASGAMLGYTATTGELPIRNPQTDSTEGHIFYVYYQREGAGDPATRPLTIVFNGGPGSSTVWLHMGAYGPKRVKRLDDGAAGPPPYSYEDNPHTLLDQTDLVFLDPVGTGYSRPAKPSDGPKFWGLDEDVRATGEFIRLFLTRYGRWGSPKFVSGESYGTTRAAHLSGWLVDNGIALNGVALISTVLNFELSRTDRGNDIAYAGYFPSHAFTGWFHQRLAPELQAMTAAQFQAAVDRFTADEYVPWLMKGEGALTAAERDAMHAKLARWTGLSREFLAANDGRIPLARAQVALLAGERKVHGRLDSRFTAYNTDPGAAQPAFDPSESNIRNDYTPVLNDYVRRQLGWTDERPYWILGGGIGPWRYEQAKYPNVVPSLERAFAKNPHMKLYVAFGYYDMATPYWAVQYTLDHMSVDPAVRAGIQRGYFTAGHMMYIDEPSMRGLRADLRRFIDSAVPK